MPEDRYGRLTKPLLVTAIALVALFAASWLGTSQVFGGHIERKLRAKGGEEPKPEPKRKPSDVFRVRHVDVTGVQFTYEDRTRPGTMPAVWRKLDLDLKIDPKSGSLYAWHFVAHNEPVAKLDGGGTFDVDEAW